MIRYSLRCGNNHEFEGWFRSSDAYELQRADGLVACSLCGSTDVSKALMAPAVSQKSTADKKPVAHKAGAAPVPATADPPSLSRPASEIEKAIGKLRAHIEANSDYVGKDFASQARSMHAGEMPSRPIHGEADAKAAKELIEEGVSVLPLPFLPRQKTN